MPWIKEENPDFLCIQETKLQAEILDDEARNIEGYYSYFSFEEKKGYSGVATYSREQVISVAHGIGIKKFDKVG